MGQRENETKQKNHNPICSVTRSKFNDSSVGFSELQEQLSNGTDLLKNPILHTKYAEMSQNPNVTHIDEWIQNNAWVAFLSIIVTVMKKKPLVWKTTPKRRSEWAVHICTFSRWVKWAGWKLGRWGVRRQRLLLPQAWSPRRDAPVWIWEFSHHIKKARSEHTSKEWNESL